MNIFVLDPRPAIAARYHNDRHVVKMILESAQILCTALHEYGSEQTIPYKPTHAKHPCTRWVCESADNWNWLHCLIQELSSEYRFRWNRVVDHMSWLAVRDLSAFCLPYNGLTPFALAMPDEFKTQDPVESYRKYYLNHKRHLAKWTKREAPEWWK